MRLEHLFLLGKTVYGLASPKAQEWAEARSKELDEGAVEKVLAAMRRLKPTRETVKGEVRKTIGYFAVIKSLIFDL